MPSVPRDNIHTTGCLLLRLMIIKFMPLLGFHDQSLHQVCEDERFLLFCARINSTCN